MANNNNREDDSVNYPPRTEKRLSDHGIDRDAYGGYDPPYVNMEGWKFGTRASQRSRGQNANFRPELKCKPGEDPDEVKVTQLRDRPYNWHSAADHIANIFRGLCKDNRNYCTSIFHNYKNKRQNMSSIAKKQQRRRKVAQLLLEGGYNQTEMAEMLGVSRTTVHNDLKALDKMWRQEMSQSVDTYKARLVQRLSYSLRENKEAWERSKLKKVKEKVKTKEDSKGNKESKEVTVSEEDLIGDPRFLENFADNAIDIALFQGVEKQDSTKFEVTIMPPLPEEKFGRYGITSEDYDNRDDSNDLENVKMRMESDEKERLKQEQVRLKARSMDAEDVEFEEIEDGSDEEE